MFWGFHSNFGTQKNHATTTIRERQRRRRKCARKVWTRAWILRRKQFGLYDQLMVELRNEDQTEFCNFMRMPPEMFDEILIRIRHIISKKRTWYREPIEPGLKLAITLRHLASGNKFASLKFGWSVPANTQSIIICEVRMRFLLIFTYIYSNENSYNHLIWQVSCDCCDGCSLSPGTWSHFSLRDSCDRNFYDCLVPFGLWCFVLDWYFFKVHINLKTTVTQKCQYTWDHFSRCK